MKRIFLLGPPGSERKEYAKRIKEQFDLQLIDTSELLNKEAEKDTPEAKRIKEAFAQNVFGKFSILNYLLGIDIDLPRFPI